jgi:hypothetical protein
MGSGRHLALDVEGARPIAVWIAGLFHDASAGSGFRQRGFDCLAFAETTAWLRADKALAAMARREEQHVRPGGACQQSGSSDAGGRNAFEEPRNAGPTCLGAVYEVGRARGCTQRQRPAFGSNGSSGVRVAGCLRLERDDPDAQLGDVRPRMRNDGGRDRGSLIARPCLGAWRWIPMPSGGDRPSDDEDDRSFSARQERGSGKRLKSDVRSAETPSQTRSSPRIATRRRRPTRDTGADPGALDAKPWWAGGILFGVRAPVDSTCCPAGTRGRLSVSPQRQVRSGSRGSSRRARQLRRRPR